MQRVRDVSDRVELLHIKNLRPARLTVLDGRDNGFVFVLIADSDKMLAEGVNDGVGCSELPTNPRDKPVSPVGDPVTRWHCHLVVSGNNKV